MKGWLPFAAFIMSSAIVFGQVDCVEKPLKVANACGVVLNPDRAGVPDAHVSFVLQGARHFDTVSDKDGRFAFDFAGGSGIDLTADARGFMRAEWVVKNLRATRGAVCKKPIYIVLAVGGESCGYMTTRRTDLSKPGR